MDKVTINEEELQLTFAPTPYKIATAIPVTICSAYVKTIAELYDYVTTTEPGL